MLVRLRAVVPALALAMLLASCSGTSNDASLVGSSSAPEAQTTLGKVPECTAFGAVPAAGEVTWLEHTQAAGLVRSPRGCLAAVDPLTTTVSWSGSGERVLAGHQVVGNSGAVRAELAGRGNAAWSRPTGKSLLLVDKGRLLKEAVGQPVSDISFLDRTDSAIYHPSGRSIVAAGSMNGTDGVWIANNLGLGAQPLSTGEGPVKVTDMAFTASGALLFVADHGDQLHVHRLEFTPAFKLSTINSYAKTQAVADLTTSPFSGGGVAYDYAPNGGCTAPSLWVSRGGQVLPTKGTEVEHGRPVGWLPEGGLVVLVRPAGCDHSPGALYVFKDGNATLVTKTADAAGVRAVYPPPPAPPTNIPSDAPT